MAMKASDMIKKIDEMMSKKTDKCEVCPTCGQEIESEDKMMDEEQE